MPKKVPTIVQAVRTLVENAHLAVARRDFEMAHTCEDDALHLLVKATLEGVSGIWLREMAAEIERLMRVEFPRNCA